MTCQGFQGLQLSQWMTSVRANASLKQANLEVKNWYFAMFMVGRNEVERRERETKSEREGGKKERN